MAAHRDLLYGLLALQVGMIDQGQLVAAFRAWTRDGSLGLGDHLAARDALDDEQRLLLDALSGQHLRKHGGVAGRSLASLAVSQSARDAIRPVGGPEVDATLAFVGGGSTEESGGTISYSVGSATSEGQRFRILRPHARGAWAPPSWPSTAN